MKPIRYYQIHFHGGSMTIAAMHHSWYRRHRNSRFTVTRPIAVEGRRGISRRLASPQSDC